MHIETEVFDSVDQIISRGYQSLFLQSGAPHFYDPRFLRAAERSPLLAVRRTFYLLASVDGQPAALMPIYRQGMNTVDPFCVLEKTAGLRNAGNDEGLFSHIMHCFDSTIVSISQSPQVYRALFDALREVAEEQGVRYFAILNVQDAQLLEQAKRHGLHVNYMLDKYYVDLSPFRDFPHFVECLPADGRHEMNRQLRKFEAGGGQAHVVAPPFDDRLKTLTKLVYSTTLKNGTPQYWPAQPLELFTQICGDLMRLILIEAKGDVVGGLICFEDKDIFHIWSAGMVYDKTDFSPYTISFATGYRYAFERGFKRVEGGRLNARIKERLGLKPMPLYSISSPDLYAQSPRPNHGMVSPGVPVVHPVHPTNNPELHHG